MEFDSKITALLKSANNGRIAIRDFGRVFPDITAQIRDDAAAPWLDCWGYSKNIDEHENAQIVDRKILSLIGRLAKTSIRKDKLYHAGLMHTYGYLFSQLETRFGYKRKRWTSGVIERGFGLKPNLFSPAPDHGTLLGNVTCFLTQISMPGKMASGCFTGVNQDEHPFWDFRFDRLKITRIRESVRFSGTRSLCFLWDLVRFKKEADGLSSLLVYSFSNNSVQKLVTCFPISKTAHQQYLRDARKTRLPIVPRFNLSISGFPENGVEGTRDVAELKLQHQKISKPKKHARREQTK